MALFSKSDEGYLGVDIGTASIKLVELNSWHGKPKLVTYGYADIVSDVIHSKSAEAQEKIARSLKKVIAQAGASTNLTLAALPTFSVFNSIISLPAMSVKDLTSAVRWEAKKYVPLPLEEMILDWKIIDGQQPVGPAAVIKPLPDKTSKKKSFLGLFGSKGRPGEVKKKPAAKTQLQTESDGSLKILVTAAPKNLVSRYLSIFKQAGLKLLSLETESFALARSLIGKDKSTVMIIDVGSVTSDICIINKGVPVLNRSIDIGGLTITKAIAGSLNVNLERAEQFKRDFGVSTAGGEGINKTIADSISPIINEIKYVFDLYQGQGTQAVEKIVLAGGSAFLPNLTEYLEKLFNKPAIIGNPWDRVVYPEDLRPVLDEIGPRLAVAIGLAMRDIK
ncbi:MAG TPA: pilus assembly protein PilM [Patescibacteria group bacterium]|nr:pilus assembly protein PilM [Patescibacteria group bacterium]